MSETNPDHQILHRWIANTLKPVLVIYVLVVFAVFIGVARFWLHSTDGVKALLMTALGSVVAMIPSLLTKVEYRLTASVLEKRVLKSQTQDEFTEVFQLKNVEYIKKFRHGFKYYQYLDQTNPIVKFMQRHVLTGYSGEVHCESVDAEIIYAILSSNDIQSK